MRKLIYASFVSLIACGAVGYAQEVERKAQTRISVEDGKDVTLTGCVVRSPEGGFMLTNAAGKDGASASYMLVSADKDDVDNLDDLVGHRVEVKGKAADKGSGKVKIKSKSEVESASGDTRKRESKTEVQGDLDGLPFLGVKSVRTIATVCP